MANAKLKCVKCKERFLRDDMIKTNVGNFCSTDCQISWGIEKGNKDRENALTKKKREDRAIEKKKKKKAAKFKKDFYDNDSKTRKAAAQKAFNNFIRERDRDQPCISCGRYHKGRYDAGHYKTVGAHPELRFNEDNCHKQCHWDCNINKSGNIAKYRIRLVKRIGLERVEALESHNEPKIYTCDDYKEIELYYKNKLKGIQND